MPLRIAPLVLSDFDTMISHASRFAPGDDLVAPPISPLCWPVRNSDDARRRLEFNMAHQRERFLKEHSARFMKVVDDDNGEIVCLARWHYYPEGYVYDREIGWEAWNLVPEGIERAGGRVPKAFNVEMYKSVVDGRMKEREGWQERANPCWSENPLFRYHLILGTLNNSSVFQRESHNFGVAVLMNMVTRESQRGRGAAGMLISWGAKQAEADCVPAYLEASVLGKPVYTKYGFTEVGEASHCDLKPYGLDVVFIIAHMAKLPLLGEAKSDE
jgi:hypothetical protein